MAARFTAHSVVLILNHLKMDAVGHTLISLVEEWVDALADTVIERVSGMLKVAVESVTAQLKSTLTTMAVMASQFTATTTATTTSY